MLETTAFQQDRRRRRSSDPNLALGYQLDQVLEDFGLECCVVVDEDGDVIAASPESPTTFVQNLSQLLPVMAMLPEHREGHLNALRRYRPDLDSDEVACSVFRAGGRRRFIAAVGPEAVMNEVAIVRAITGARRIHRNAS